MPSESSKGSLKALISISLPAISSLNILFQYVKTTLADVRTHFPVILSRDSEKISKIDVSLLARRDYVFLQIGIWIYGMKNIFEHISVKIVLLCLQGLGGLSK